MISFGLPGADARASRRSTRLWRVAPPGDRDGSG